VKVSRQQASANRARVVEVASELFRAKGLDGIGVAELMRQAGLTHGGFYANFASKHDLAIEAVDAAFAGTRQKLLDVVAGAEDPLAALVKYYLSPLHRDDAQHGCVVAAIAGEAGRQDKEFRAAFERGILAYLSIIDDGHEADASSPASDRAIATLSTLVGALTLTRAVADPALADRILAAAGEAILSARK
jgi:TetR/AcrR family transcriptional repressor of nem operon